MDRRTGFKRQIIAGYSRTDARAGKTAKAATVESRKKTKGINEK